MTDGTTINVQGLQEFSRSLRRLDAEAPKALRVALNTVAEAVLDKARPQIPRRTGKARASLKVASTRTAARVRVGGKKAPYFPWLDFGGRTGRRKSVLRPFIKEGRYIYPVLRKGKREFADVMRTALADVAQSAGLDVD